GLWWWKSKSAHDNKKSSSRPNSRRNSTDNGSRSSSSAPLANPHRGNSSGSDNGQLVVAQPGMLTTANGEQQSLMAAGLRMPTQLSFKQSPPGFWGSFTNGFSSKPTPHQFFDTVRSRQHKVVVQLIEAQANINAQSDEGITAAHIAALIGDT